VSHGRRTPGRERKKGSAQRRAAPAGDGPETPPEEALSLAALRATWRNPIYVDEQKVCTECGTSFVVTAREKKYWNETLRITSHFSPRACQSCRRAGRTARALNTQLSKAVQLVARHPDDPAALLALARVTAESAQASGTGDLDRGIAAARRARRIKPKLHETLYWEAVCQDLAGRTQKAMTLYEAFVESAHVPRNHPTFRTARERIAEARAADTDSS